MRAVGVTRFGGPEVLDVVDIPEPIPSSGEVRIRVHGAAVNPTDTGFRSGATAARFEGAAAEDCVSLDSMRVAGRSA